MKSIKFLGLALCSSFILPATAESAPKPLNIVLITADDMNSDSIGAFGCKIPGITPNLDALAKQGMRFEHAHVTIAVCQPSRTRSRRCVPRSLRK